MVQDSSNFSYWRLHNYVNSINLSPAVMNDDLCLTFGFFYLQMHHLMSNSEGPNIFASSDGNTYLTLDL